MAKKKKLAGKFPRFRYVPSLFFFCSNVFRFLVLLCLPLPAPFHSPVPKCTPCLLSSSSFLHSLNLFSAPALMGPRFPPLTPFYPHSLPYPPPALLCPQMPASPRTRGCLHFVPPRLHHFHRQITQKCSVIVPMSAILLSPHATLPPVCLRLTPPFGGPVGVRAGRDSTPL